MRQKLPSQPEIRDTQCGFKLFTRASARAIFPLAHIERWIFDVELLLLAEMASKASRGSVLDARRRADKKSNGDLEEDPKAPATLAEDKAAPAATADPLLDLPLPIAEIPVQWAEVGGSKIDLLKDSIRMALDLCVIRANYALGRWKSPKPVSIDARA